MRFFSSLFLLLLTMLPALAQEDGGRVVRGHIVDATTLEAIPDVSISLLAAADSSLITTYQPEPEDTFMARHFGIFTLPVKKTGKYLIRTSCIGYQTVYTPFEVKLKRQGDVELRRITMRPESRMLNEVTVTGTKIKMVLRGDTLVYNAEAFNLAEGSMLDALIRQLPGAELSKDGEIKVNGKRIDNLLVDGRDFFSGNPKAALENLPAYTVSKVKVFDRTGKVSKMMGRDMGDKSYVMDVRLKKQYAVELMGNLEASAGTSDRYNLLGSMMRTAGKTSMTLAVDMGNVDSSQRRMTESGVTPDLMYIQPAAGVTTSHGASFIFSRGSFEDDFSFNGEVYGLSENKHTDTWTSSQTYLEGGDTYGRSENFVRSGQKHFDGRFEVSFSPKGLVGNANVRMNYDNNDSHSNSRSANYDADPTEYGALLDSLFLNPERFRQVTLYRQQSRSKSNREQLGVSGYVNLNIKTAADVIALTANGSYSRSESESFQLNDLNYLKMGGVRDLRDNYTKAPATNINFYTEARYNLGLGQHNLALGYQYRHDYNDNENLRYRLDRLEGRNEDTPYDLLPSTAAALQQVIDAPNSYTSKQYDDNHLLDAALRLKPRFLGSGSAVLTLPLSYTHKRYDYYRETAQQVSQDVWVFNPKLTIDYVRQNKMTEKLMSDDGIMNIPRMIRADFSIGLTTTVPDITSMVVYRDDSNPLNVQLSNANLKRTRQLSINSSYSNIGGRLINSTMLQLSYNRTFNAIATSMVYDKASGRTTTQPVNVNGNWTLSGGITYSQFLDAKQCWEVTSDLTIGYNHNVDLNSVAGAANKRSIVHNTSLSEQLTLTHRFGRGNEIGIHGGGNWNAARSSREGFERINAGNIIYGMGILLELPWKLQLQTTLTNYSRRGYSDPQMNTDELILIAKVCRPLLKDAINLSIEGFDLLGQLSNRQYTINEQGRTETYSNMVTQFALLKLTWRFMKSPKRKG